MKNKLLLGLLAILCITLVGCKESNGKENLEKEKWFIDAKGYCEDEGGKIEMWEENDEYQPICSYEEEGFSCYLEDLYDGLCQKGGDIKDENLEEYKMQSLIDADLEELAKTHFPTSYNYVKYDENTQEIESGEYTYPEGTAYDLVDLIPGIGKAIDKRIISSGIENGMIHTNVEVNFEDDSIGNILYIVNPVTLDFVEADVEIGGIITNYQFVY